MKSPFRILLATLFYVSILAGDPASAEPLVERLRSLPVNDSGLRTYPLAQQDTERTYALFVPGRPEEKTGGVGGSSGLPLVIALHGGHGNGKRLAARIGFNRLAEDNGFMVAYPDATGTGHWNDGRHTTASGLSDVDFIALLIEDIDRRFSLDRSRIYAVGISNGGSFAARLACEMTSTLAAIAQVVSTMSTDLKSTCQPSEPIPVLLINGVEDPLVPWNGGELRKSRQLGRGGSVVGSEDISDFWAKHNGCRVKPPSKNVPDLDPEDGTRVTEQRFEDCESDAEVILYSVQGGGHTWPGTRPRPRLERIVGRTSQDIDATKIIWEFFSRHRANSR